VHLPDPDDVRPYSSWDVATHGPDPRPGWVVTELSALDTELGILKTGKEADVHLVHRGVPGMPGTLLEAKRYRPAERRMFHRDAGYTEGRRVRRSRETRAMARRTEFGRELLAGQWADAEFAALSALWPIEAPVPTGNSRRDRADAEFVGEADGTAAPRLAQYRVSGSDAADLFEQCRTAMQS
jgi:RIO kinase 1